MSPSAEQGASAHTTQRMRSGPFPPEMVGLLTSQRRDLTRQLLATPLFREQLDRFHEEDVMGRTWWQLHEERRLMKEVEKKTGIKVLPPHVQVGFDMVYQALSGLWFKQVAYERGTIYPTWYPSIPDEEVRQIERDFDQFDRGTIQQLLEKDSTTIPKTVALLMRRVDEQGETKYADLLAKPRAHRRALAEFRMGTQLAWDEWRVNSTLG